MQAGGRGRLRNFKRGTSDNFPQKKGGSNHLLGEIFSKGGGGGLYRTLISSWDPTIECLQVVSASQLCRSYQYGEKISRGSLRAIWLFSRSLTFDLCNLIEVTDEVSYTSH